MWVPNFVICRKHVSQKMPNDILPEVAGNIFRSSIPKTKSSGSGPLDTHPLAMFPGWTKDLRVVQFRHRRLQKESSVKSATSFRRPANEGGK